MECRVWEDSSVAGSSWRERRARSEWRPHNSRAIQSPHSTPYILMKLRHVCCHQGWYTCRDPRTSKQDHFNTFVLFSRNQVHALKFGSRQIRNSQYKYCSRNRQTWYSKIALFLSASVVRYTFLLPIF